MAAGIRGTSHPRDCGNSQRRRPWTSCRAKPHRDRKWHREGLREDNEAACGEGNGDHKQADADAALDLSRRTVFHGTFAHLRLLECAVPCWLVFPERARRTVGLGDGHARVGVHALPEAATRLLLSGASREAAPSAIPRGVKGGVRRRPCVVSSSRGRAVLCQQIQAQYDRFVDVDGRHRGISPKRCRIFRVPAHVRASALQRDLTRLCECRRRLPRASGWAMRIKASARCRRLSRTDSRRRTR